MRTAFLCLTKPNCNIHSCFPRYKYLLFLVETGTNSQSFTSIVLPWIQCKLGKQYLLNKVTLPWESNPGPSPIRGVIVAIIVSVGFNKY